MSVDRLGSEGRVELESTSEASLSTEPEHELLDRQVARVSRLLTRVTSQLDPHRSIHGQREALPRVEGVAATSPTLDRADGRTRQPGSLTELLLREPPSMAGCAELTSEAGELLEVDSSDLSCQFGTLELCHSSCMVALSTWLSLSDGSGPIRRPSHRPGT